MAALGFDYHATIDEINNAVKATLAIDNPDAKEWLAKLSQQLNEARGKVPSADQLPEAKEAFAYRQELKQVSALPKEDRTARIENLTGCLLAKRASTHQNLGLVFPSHTVCCSAVVASGTPQATSNSSLEEVLNFFPFLRKVDPLLLDAIVKTIWVVIDFVCCFFTIAGLRQSVAERATWRLLRELGETGLTGFAHDVYRIVQAWSGLGVMDKARTVWKVIGGFKNVIGGIGKIIGAIAAEMKWYDYILSGVTVVAQLVAWFATEGLAFVAELALAAVFFVQTTIDVVAAVAAWIKYAKEPTPAPTPSQSGLPARLILGCSGAEKGQVLSHSNNKLGLKSGSPDKSEQWIVRTVEGNAVAFEAADAEHGRYLSHAFGKMGLQDGYRGLGEAWVWDERGHSLQALGAETGTYLSHASGKLELRKGVSDSERWVYTQPANAAMKIVCAGSADKDKTLSHAYNKLFLQNGYKGEGELWLMNPLSGGAMSFEARGAEHGRFLSHAFAKMDFQNGYRGLGEAWLWDEGKGSLQAIGAETGTYLSHARDNVELQKAGGGTDAQRWLIDYL
eukprot:TRINITY_DN946_c0_g1_i1.p1 TRINITY_DN946_c0_g1~~TRINITY_DN946_c0_g1_i1.p1  ORF type:complete len:564 (+),score=134.81 TRINITY_DN946_c0_g1_i1:629-2320(+)